MYNDVSDLSETNHVIYAGGGLVNQIVNGMEKWRKVEWRKTTKGIMIKMTHTESQIRQLNKTLGLVNTMIDKCGIKKNTGIC